MKEFMQFTLYFSAGLAALIFLMKIAIDILFTTWDPVKHYRRVVNDSILKKLKIEPSDPLASAVENGRNRAF